VRRNLDLSVRFNDGHHTCLVGGLVKRRCFAPLVQHGSSVLAYQFTQLLYLHLYSIQLQILCPMLAYCPICLVAYSPKLDMVTYIQHAVSYGEIYRRGEPIGLSGLCDAIQPT